MRISALLTQGEDAVGMAVVLKGWVRTVRKQKSFSFVEVNDGSSMKSVQVVAPSEIDTYRVTEELSTGAAIAVWGDVVPSPAKGQSFEVKATRLELVGACDGASYPIQKKKTSLEFLRSIAHLRARTNSIAAVARVRSTLAQATHQFFQGEGFRYVQTPLITASDCEGAGEMFRVTTLPADPSEVPMTKDGKVVDYSQDFFGKPAFLTVSGQLSAETMACALGDVYTFGPTFRAEDSNTGRHLAEFWMIEPEMAFADLQDDMDNAEQFVKFAVAQALEHCADDLEFFDKFYEKGLLEKLRNMGGGPFGRVRYAEAVEMVAAEISKDPSKWEFPECKFGTDLATEHERWISEVAFGRPTFVYDYPKEIKAFYMRDNEDGKTVAAMDLLVPGIGELIGGSQREERLDELRRKMADAGLDEEAYWWYLDLRRFGSVPHSGYGLGFERLVCFVTGMTNIRDAVAFPRYPGSCEF
jgi:asparaginyl-tRNA synthetase